MVNVRGIALSFGLIASLSVAGRTPVSENLFPSTVGSTWDMSGTAPGVNEPINMRITVVKNNPANHQVVLRYMNGAREFQQETYAVTAKEVTRMRSGPGGSGIITPPLPVIKYPVAVGKSWKWAGTISQPTKDGKRQAIHGAATVKYGAFESISTSAGNIKAYRVDLNLTMTAGGQSASIANSYWYAPKIGMIKQVADFGNGRKIEGILTSYRIN